jgi:hypothetical protein
MSKLNTNEAIDEIFRKLEYVPPDAKDAPLGLFSKEELKQAILQLIKDKEAEEKTKLQTIVETATDDFGQISPDLLFELVMEELGYEEGESEDQKTSSQKSNKKT